MTWQVIIPVKSLDDAKTRLAAQDRAERGEFALAFAQDAISAVRSCPSVNGVVVVTDDPRVLDALGTWGVTFHHDRGHGLNRSIEEAAAALPVGNTAALVADLPALTSTELEAALAEAELHPRSFVCDAAGVGTTLLAATRGYALNPLFGGHSRAAHAASGAVEITASLPRLRRDVDTAVDLWDARRMGLGPSTRAILGSI